MAEGCITKWVEALRSGDYNQATGYLCTNEGYCCLGVLEKVCFNEEFEPHSSGIYSDSKRAIYKLPYDRANKVGLSLMAQTHEREAALKLVTNTSILLPTAPSRQDVLTFLNDARTSFDKIADFIEEMGWDKEVN